jgi:hypothetical protein
MKTVKKDVTGLGCAMHLILLETVPIKSANFGLQLSKETVLVERNATSNRELMKTYPNSSNL